MHNSTENFIVSNHKIAKSVMKPMDTQKLIKQCSQLIFIFPIFYTKVNLCNNINFVCVIG